ncbi:hypothetical protein [Shinella kummerowiae]|jgi:hypothetical protein|uniref:Uncharacterized protein n=1 Tax=Shinella kummerowiae TaxID=417745 RepID=A0A6N8SKB3_9HYPH|nr:hypothetical protein [Shinella kummerowiae]MCT7668022.1 hypothetical protein [Shinella kummerowiae]MXN49241.1 hypothetical protein [Shinella kummerowiae]
MSTMFQIIALSSIDPFSENRQHEPKLLYPDALKAAQALKSQGKAFRVYTEGAASEEQRRAFVELGVVE